MATGRLLQAELAVGASDDPLELEAERVADQVMQGAVKPAIDTAPPRIQRAQAPASHQAAHAPASVERVLAGPSQPLEPLLQADMGRRFGRDFSHVRVHADATAAASANELDANAYTVGRDLVFGRGRFEPTTARGQRLLAHELTHVVQQSGGSSLQSPAGGGRTIGTMSQPAASGHALVQRDQADDDERRRKAMLAGLPALVPDGQGWGVPKVADVNPKSHPTAPGLGPKPQPRSPEEFIVASKCPSHHRTQPASLGLVGDEAVLKMSKVDKLAAAVEYAKESFHDKVKAEVVGALFTKQALFAMVFFAGLFILAQSNPGGWAAAAAILAGLTITALFVGYVLFEIMKDLIKFVSAVNATTFGELRESGAALSRAIAKAEVAVIIALLTHTFKGGSGAKPMDGPPAGGFADAVTADGTVIRAPIEALPAPVEAPGNLASSGGSGKLTGSGPEASRGTFSAKSGQGTLPKSAKTAAKTAERGQGIQDLFDEAQGKVTEEARATEGQGRTVTPGLGGAEPRQFQRGNFAHRFANYIFNRKQLPLPNEPEVTVQLRDGTGDIIRTDRLVRRPTDTAGADKGLLIEVKPRGRSADIGRAQLPVRAAALQREFPRKDGWDARVIEYDQADVEAWLRSESMSPADIAKVLDLFGFDKAP